ncbi:uncharacterized protein K441DRAFT_560356 [Cenococcum geophilum 1.58]|uniref:uncharacterized protein n=1 Tax=Cenococcum geophilum 1.58 TaxID=794803 RepID=UPI0035900D1B|nr:hypothetical protein K441DRAFT_560356 [Cenococcum geophilum 1.58]
MSYITAENGSRQPMFLIVTGFNLLLSTIAVLLRLFCRIAYVHYVGIDDYFMVAAWVVTTGMGIMNVFHISWGTGSALVCLSIGISAFECRNHPSRAWSLTFPQGCNNLPASYFATASINIFTDIVILVLPLRSFAKLNLHRRKRWALIGIFLTGTVAVIASIARLIALYIFTTTKDIMYNAIFILLWSQIEVNLAIISASAPALRPIFNKAFQTSSYNQQGAYGGSHSAGNAFPRGQRVKGNGQIELYSYNGDGNNAVAISGGSTSEELILEDDGITKTVETRIDIEEDDDDHLTRR